MVGEGFLTTLKKSLKEGKVTQKQIDDACRRILEAKYKLGLFDDPYRYLDSIRALNEVRTADKLKATRDAAVRSTVLLKNDRQTLPLKKGGSIALIGPLANDKPNMLGTWAISGDNKLSTPILEGMQRVGGNNLTIRYAKGANITDDTALAKKGNVHGMKIFIDSLSPDRMIEEAVRTAQQSDVIVAVVGESAEFSGEASSRTDLDLPESQKKLLAALKKTGKPLVVVLLAGRPMTISEELEQADALLLAWFLGHEAGNAIGDVLFGDYNPSGKLTMSFPVNVGQIPVYYNHKNTGRPQPVGPTQKFKTNYLDAPNDPLLPFGFGLSYTSFKYSPISLSSSTIRPGQKIRATVTVINTGNYDGEEVVQLYVRDLVASVTQPVKKLKGFQKILLKKGESREVVFEITEEQLKFFNSDLKWVSEPGDFHLFIGTSSMDVQKADLKLVK
jgi:beta-glucosidase